MTIFFKFIRSFGSGGLPQAYRGNLYSGAKLHNVSWERHFGSRSVLTNAEMSKIKPFVPSSYFRLAPKRTHHISIEDKRLSVVNVLLGEGGDKKVYLGILESGTNLSEVAILIYRFSSGWFSSFSPKKPTQEMEEKIDELNRVVELFEPVKDNPFLDLSSLTGAEIVGNEVIVAKPLAISDLYTGLTGDMSCSTFLHIMRDATRGLDAMHKAGLVHSDVKPHNILIKKVDTVPGLRGVLTDFDGSGKEGSVIHRSTPFYLPASMPKDDAGNTIIKSSTDLFSIGRIIIDAFSQKDKKWCDKNREDQINFLDEIRDLGSRLTENGIIAKKVIEELDILITRAENLDFPRLGKKNLKKNFEPTNYNW